MSRRAIVIVVASLLVGALPSTPVPAFNGPGCGGNWPPPANAPADRQNPCSISTAGVPITVSGSAYNNANPNAQVSVRAWLSPQGHPDVVLLECSDSGRGSASCSTGVPDSTCASPIPDVVCETLIPQQYRALALQCHVQGTPRGTWFCQTGNFPS